MIHRKTAKGQAEIDSRAHGLPQNLRMLLLLIDGQRNAADLQRMLAAATPQALSTLLSGGFIEAVVPATTTAQQPITTPLMVKPGTIGAMGLVPPGSRASKMGGVSSMFHSVLTSRLPSFAAVQEPAVVRSLRRALPSAEAEAFIQRMHQVDNSHALQALIVLAQEAIARRRGQAAADEFGSRYGELEALA
jgi:hypothetical protein